MGLANSNQSKLEYHFIGNDSIKFQRLIIRKHHVAMDPIENKLILSLNEVVVKGATVDPPIP